MRRNYSLHASLGDKTLWKQTLTGDKQAFGDLYTRFYPALKRYGYKLVDESELVEDAIHDLFLTVWQSRQALNAEAPVGYYLANSLRHAINRKMMKQITESGDLNESCASYPSSEDLYLSVEEECQRATFAEQLLQKLPARQREIVRLHYFEAKSHNEIRQIMQISSQSVYNVLWITLKKLRKMYVLSNA